MKCYFFQTITLAIFLVAGNISFAQVQLGVKAGWNLSNTNIENESGKTAETQMNNGMHIGLTLDIPLGKALYLQPGFLHSKKGYKQESNAYGSSSDFEVQANYLEVPLNLLFKPSFGICNLIVGAGGYMAYGVGGKWSSGTNPVIGDIALRNQGNLIFDKELMNGGDIQDYNYGRPLDYGVNFLAGVEFFQSLSVMVSSQWGLANLKPYVNGGTYPGSIRNYAWGVSIGYLLK